MTAEFSTPQMEAGASSGASAVARTRAALDAGLVEWFIGDGGWYGADMILEDYKNLPSGSNEQFPGEGKA